MNTIAAITTPPGPAARAVVRTSGPAAFELAERLGVDDAPARRATVATLRLPVGPVPAEIYAFAAPASHTGEDVIEYHLPGSTLMSLVLDALLAAGAERAGPGAFTSRAFANDKVDLAAAEAMQMAVAAEGEAELAATQRLRAGGLVQALAEPIDRITSLLASCEAAIDFAGEADVTDFDVAAFRSGIVEIVNTINTLQKVESRRSNESLPTIVLVGRPNAGKSTLVNALLDRPRMIASAEAGTTRDAVPVLLNLDGVTVQLVDLPGLSAAPRDALDAAAQQRAEAAARSADVVALVVDATDETPPPDVRHDLVVRTKADLLAVAGDAVSAVARTNLDSLRRRLREVVQRSTTGARLALNDRHRDGLARAVAALDQADASIEDGEELAAVALRDAVDALCQLTDRVPPEEVLAKVFATFCVGK